MFSCNVFGSQSVNMPFLVMCLVTTTPRPQPHGNTGESVMFHNIGRSPFYSNDANIKARIT